MSLPGDREIDTDPRDEPDDLDIIQDICEHLRETFSRLEDVHTVLSDESASPAARALAIRQLELSTRGNPVGEIEDRAVRLQEEVDTLNDLLNSD